MSLAELGEKARENLETERQPLSKIDRVLKLLPEEDSAQLLSWLHDPERWSGYMIAKALHSYGAKEAMPSVTCGHSTIERWRMLNGIEFDK